MNTRMFLVRFLAAATLACALPLLAADAKAPKKVLVVSVTKGFHHTGCEVGNKVIGEMAKSSGLFTADFVTDDEGLKTKMTVESLKGYDAVIFNNTSGDLPLPDKQGFLDWVKSGKGFVGIHAASDTLRAKEPIDPYCDMVGAEFEGHGPQSTVDCVVQDPEHPACKPLGKSLKLHEEIYLFVRFDRSKVHDLMALDKHPNSGAPGYFPIAWSKDYGKGRMFYTALGHREDVWMTEIPPSIKRENPPEVAKAFQAHLLGGIKWALGLEKGDGQPQKNKK